MLYGKLCGYPFACVNGVNGYKLSACVAAKMKGVNFSALTRVADYAFFAAEALVKASYFFIYHILLYVGKTDFSSIAGADCAKGYLWYSLPLLIINAR